jgi:hypothetical protein
MKMSCAILNIYSRNKTEETKRLLSFFHFLKLIFNKENKFSPHLLESIDWLDKVKWSECCIANCNNCARRLCSDRRINIGDENTGMSLEIKIYENYKIDIIIDRREMMFDDNTCLEWHHRLITLLVEEGIVDVGYIFPGLPKDNPKWYSSKNEPSFWIGKRNFLILDALHGTGLFYEARKKILTNFLQKNWHEINKKDNIIIVSKKERKELLKKSSSSFFSELFYLLS